MRTIEAKRIDVSIALATRGRVESLARLLESIRKTTIHPEKIEVLLGVDYCDRDLDRIILLAQMVFEFDVIVTIQKRSPNISNDYLNRLFGMARGEWLWVMNDDAEIVTQGWDEILHTIPRTGRPTCVDIMDNTRNFNNNGEFACFPMINKHAFRAMRYFFHPSIPTWGADKWLNRVCTEAKIIESLPDIKVHHHMNINDEQHSNMETQMNAYGAGGSLDVDEEVARLQRYKCSLY